MPGRTKVKGNQRGSKRITAATAAGGSRLIEKGAYVAAFDLARRAEPILPGDPQLAKLWPEMTRVISVETEPPGAEVSWKEYAAVNKLQGLARRLAAAA